VHKPKARVVVGEHYDINAYSSAYQVGHEIPPEDIKALNVHIGMMKEISSFRAKLYNFNKKYIETYPLSEGDLVRIWVGRGVNQIQIFQGRVEELKADASAMENYLTLIGRCIGEELYRRLVTVIYQNQKGEAIIKDLIENYSRLKHVRNNVELIEETDTIYTELEYDKAKLKPILDFIADSADKSGVIGFDYRIEYDGKLAFFPRYSKTSPISLTDAIKHAVYSKTIHRIRNSVYVYGAAEKSAPADKDAWTEALTTVDGSWSSGTGTGSVSLDGTDKVEGNYSIKHTTSTSDYYARLVFKFNSGINCNKYPKLVFKIKLEAAFSGKVMIILTSASGVDILKWVTIEPDNEWHLIEEFVGRKNTKRWDVHTEWSDEDWEQIKEITIDAHFPGTGTGSFWVDNFHFTGARYGVHSSHIGCSVNIPQQDKDSIDKYGLREIAITDEELYSDDEVVARAKAILNWLKDPAESVIIQTEILDFGNNHLQPGDMITVVLPNENVNKAFRIFSIDYKLGETQEFPIEIRAGIEPLLLADYLYRIKTETSKLSQLKKGV
jgi:hypothetical protein